MKSLVILTLLIGLGIVQALVMAAEERVQYLNDAYYNVTWVGASPYYMGPQELPDGDYPTSWRVNKAFIDDSGFSALGTMRALNKSFNVTQMNWEKNLDGAPKQFGGQIVREVEFTIPTTNGNRTGKMVFCDPGQYYYGEVAIDSHEIFLFVVKEDMLPFLATLSVKEAFT